MTRQILALAFAALLTVGCGDDDTAIEGTPTTDDADAAGGDDAADPADDGDDRATGVTIEGFEFEPSSVEVSTGDSVTWTNEDGVAHTVTAGEPGSPTEDFDEDVAPGAIAGITFDEAGTFPYFCSIHPSMTAEVVVS